MNDYRILHGDALTRLRTLPAGCVHCVVTSPPYYGLRAYGVDGDASVTTVGWRPTCACPPADPIPCTVLDPFLGSGTTVAVAVGLGRHGIGIELNQDYIILAEKRIRETQRPLL